MAFAFDFSAMLAAAAAVSSSPDPIASDAPPPIQLARQNERLTCRNEKIDALMQASSPTVKDAVATRWILATCGACGLCADMARR